MRVNMRGSRGASPAMLVGMPSIASCNLPERGWVMARAWMWMRVRVGGECAGCGSGEREGESESESEACLRGG